MTAFPMVVVFLGPAAIAVLINAVRPQDSMLDVLAISSGVTAPFGKSDPTTCVGCLAPMPADVAFEPATNHPCLASLATDCTVTITPGTCSGTSPYCEPVKPCGVNVYILVGVDEDCLPEDGALCVLFPNIFPATMCKYSIVNAYCCTGAALFGRVTSFQDWTIDWSCGAFAQHAFEIYDGAPAGYAPEYYIGKFSCELSCGSCPQ